MRIEDEIKQSHFSSEYQKLAINLLYTNTYFDAFYAQVVKDFTVTLEQYNVLRILKGQHPQPMSVKDIQSRMINKMSNTSRLIDKLVQKNYVERFACEHDRRAVDIRLTELGVEQVDVISKELKSVEKEYETLTKAEAQELNTLLDKLRG